MESGFVQGLRGALVRRLPGLEMDSHDRIMTDGAGVSPGSYASVPDIKAAASIPRKTARVRDVGCT